MEGRRRGRGTRGRRRGGDGERRGEREEETEFDFGSLARSIQKQKINCSLVGDLLGVCISSSRSTRKLPCGEKPRLIAAVLQAAAAAAHAARGSGWIRRLHDGTLPRWKWRSTAIALQATRTIRIEQTSQKICRRDSQELFHIFGLVQQTCPLKIPLALTERRSRVRWFLNMCNKRSFSIWLKKRK